MSTLGTVHIFIYELASTRTFETELFSMLQVTVAYYIKTNLFMTHHKMAI